LHKWLIEKGLGRRRPPCKPLRGNELRGEENAFRHAFGLVSLAVLG
jgi:hypothetical protein